MNNNLDRWGNNYGHHQQSPYGVQQPYSNQPNYNPLTNGIPVRPDGPKGFGVTALILAIVNLIPSLILIAIIVWFLIDPSILLAILAGDSSTGLWGVFFTIFVAYSFLVTPLIGTIGVIFAILAIAQKRGKIYGIWSLITQLFSILVYILPFLVFFVGASGF